MWANQYVGIPFEELDCWQLCRRVYEYELDINLPSFIGDYADAQDRESLERIFTQELAAPSRWQTVPALEAKEYDLVLMRLSPLPTHVGILAKRWSILHTMPKTGAVIDERGSLRLRHNVVGFYRYDESS